MVIVAGEMFPPQRGAGVHRVVGWTRYLPEFGWDVAVVTLPLDYRRGRHDATLLDYVPPGTLVRRAPLPLMRLLPDIGDEGRAATTGPSGTSLRRPVNRLLRRVAQRVLVPDGRVLWVPAALVAVAQIVRERNVRAILSSSPEASSHVVAYLAAARWRLPWVADFRDPWRSVWYPQKGAALHRWIGRRVVGRADHLTVVSPNLRRHLQEEYGAAAERITVITNGIAPELFRPRPPQPPSGLFRIVHTGAFYGRRTPRSFLRAVAECVAEDPSKASALRVEFVGSTGDPEVRDDVEEFREAPWLDMSPPVPHADAVRCQRSADVLLLIPGEDSFTLPSKIFEYLASTRPILALCSADSDTAALLRELKAGLVVPQDDMGQLKNAIRELFESRGALDETDRSAFLAQLARYSQPSVVKAMARTLDRPAGCRPEDASAQQPESEVG